MTSTAATGRTIEYLSEPAATSMSDDWYEFAAADHFWMQWRLAVVRRLLARHRVPLTSVLDVGCGNGMFRQQLEAATAAAVDGCDLNEAAVRLAGAGRGRLLIYDIHDRRPELLEAYAAAFLMDVIEHIDDDRAFVESVMAHVQRRGFVVVNVPAMPALYSKYDTVAGHVRRYTPGALARVMEAGGVTPLAIVPWGLTMVPLLVLRKLLGRVRASPTTIKDGFVPPNRAADAVLRACMALELGARVPMPFGTSLCALGQRRE